MEKDFKITLKIYKIIDEFDCLAAYIAVKRM